MVVPPRSEDHRGPSGPPRRSLVATVMCRCCITRGGLIVVAVSIGFIRQAGHLDRLDRRLAAAQSEALKVRKAVADLEPPPRRIAGLRAEKLGAPSPLAVWRNSAAFLPDSAWLSGLTVRAHR